MKSHISYRISWDLWSDDSGFEQLCKDLAGCRKGYNDLALFDSCTHSVLTLEESRRRAALFRQRVATLRERQLGDKIGVNLLSTMGHHTENRPWMLKNPAFSPVTGIDGEIVEGCFCIGNENYLEHHVRLLLTAWAESGADFIWLDDDLRFFGHGGASLCCFCEDCIRRFNCQHGTSYTRETLRSAFNEGEAQMRIDLRRSWLKFSGETLCHLLAFASKCVHEVNPGIQMGGMDGGMRAGDSADYASLTMALQAVPGKSPIPRWRPGGGAYTDLEMFREMVLVKATQLGAEADFMPAFIEDIEAEIESFNHQRLRKSCRATAFEGALYCAGGTTGVAWNVLSDNDYTANAAIMKYLADYRPIMDRIVEANGRLPQQGICNLWKPGQLAVSNPEGNWEEGFAGVAGHMTFSELFGAGIPLAHRPEFADAFVLSGNTAMDYSDESLRKIFSGGVYCDGATLDILEKRGLSRLAGFRAGRRFREDALEVFTAHPLNGEYGGFWRDGRLSFARFWGDGGGVYELLPLGDCQVLATLQNYQRKQLAACSMGLFTNELGGRVIAAGYFPFTNLLFSAKLAQMKAIFQYLSNGMSAYVASYHRIRIFVRQDSINHRWVIELANASEDLATGVRIRVKHGTAKAVLTTMELAETTILGTCQEDGSYEYVLPELAPWSVNLLVSDAL